jgi:hypothetical protein
MVKKSIFAITLIGMLATVSMAQDIQMPSGQYKTDTCWPFEFIPQDICRIPIVMEVGMFVEILDCNKKKIVLKQLDCTEIGKGVGDFPCYRGCTGISVRANIDVQLSVKLYRVGDVISTTFGNPNWSAYFTNDNSATTSPTWQITGDGTTQNVTVCVIAWNSDIFKSPPGVGNSAIKVGEAAVQAVPTALPAPCL